MHSHLVLVTAEKSKARCSREIFFIFLRTRNIFFDEIATWRIFLYAPGLGPHMSVIYILDFRLHLFMLHCCSFPVFSHIDVYVSVACVICWFWEELNALLWVHRNDNSGKHAFIHVYCGCFKGTWSLIMDYMSLTADEVPNTESHTTWGNRVCGVFATASWGISVLAWSRKHLWDFTFPLPLTPLSSFFVLLHCHTGIWHVYTMNLHVCWPPVISLCVPAIVCLAEVALLWAEICLLSVHCCTFPARSNLSSFCLLHHNDCLLCHFCFFVLPAVSVIKNSSSLATGCCHGGLLLRVLLSFWGICQIRCPEQHKHWSLTSLQSYLFKVQYI